MRAGPWKCIGVALSAVSFQLSPAQQPAEPQDQAVPPQIVLAQRLGAAAARWTPLSTVVIVSDAVSYCEAIGAWSPTLRFPVLIDDGSPESREDIARFVRGFFPAHVVRYTSPNAKGAGADTFARLDVGLVRTGIATSWGVKPEDTADGSKLAAAWSEAGHAPAGLVFTGQTDPAWTAAMALAAGRGQPLLFVDCRQQLDGYLSMAEAAAFAAAVRKGAQDVGLPHAALGDAIDAVTLCLNAPIKFRPDDAAKDMLALTDFVGRTNDTVNDNPRWAWCGQVPGTAASAAYRAMSALFTQPRSAWFFDGYPDAPGWKDYDATASGEIIKKAGLAVEVLDTPNQSARDWRLRAARPVDAGIIAVTTKGNSDFFDLEPGQCKPADVPVLGLPAAVHFTHSWSIERPADRNTVGGRWLERGAFIYVGSVHEPFLHAFVPNPVFITRIGFGVPFITSARQESGPVGAKPWKVATLGDPLFSLFNRAQNKDEPVPLQGTTAIDASLRDDLTAERYAEALTTLVLAGRDPAAAKLAQTLREKKPDVFVGPVAGAAVLPLFRSGQTRESLIAFSLADPRDRRNPAIRDAAMLASYPFREAGADKAVTDAIAVLDAAN